MDFQRTGKTFIICVIAFQLVSCGTILYPERKGQKDGRIDPGVAVLDAIGLLFFVVPGVVAFAVDFYNGTIYLPDSYSRNIKKIKFDTASATPESIAALVREATGATVDWHDARLNVVRLERTEDLPRYFARFEQGSTVQLGLLGGR